MITLTRNSLCPLVSCHGARRCYRRSQLSNQFPSECIYTLLGWDNFLLCLRKETHTPQKHIPLTRTHIPNVITFCLEQSKCLRAGMTASFYWRWKRRAIKQVSAGTAEMHCFHDSHLKNDAMRPTMQRRVCSGLAKVSLRAVPSAVQALEEENTAANFAFLPWGCNGHLDFPTAMPLLCSVLWAG